MIGLAYEELWLWMLVISLGILAVEVGILLCVWLGDRVRGFIYRWKHRNDPPPKGAEFGIALGTLQGFVCFGCPGLTNVRHCAICRLKRDEKKGEEK